MTQRPAARGGRAPRALNNPAEHGEAERATGAPAANAAYAPGDGAPRALNNPAEHGEAERATGAPAANAAYARGGGAPRALNNPAEHGEAERATGAPAANAAYARGGGAPRALNNPAEHGEAERATGAPAANAAYARGGGAPRALNNPAEHGEAERATGAPAANAAYARGGGAPRALNNVDQLLRELTPQVLGAVVRRFGDFAAAEDAVQEALIAAATQWPNEGEPENPRGWLIQVAVRRMTDAVRADSARRRREQAAATLTDHTVPAIESGDATTLDDTLILLFMCCHPSLSPSSAIALTLRAVGGLTTREIAHAFLVPEATMAQRISRAKQTIKASGVPFDLPSIQDRAHRLGEVLHVLYLIFNEGYTTSNGQSLHRTDLSSEAIRLTRSVHHLLPEDAETAGLLALMLLTDARRAARTGTDGELIPLTTQDRTLWDRAQIAEGVALITATLPKGAIGAYQLQAAIAALHDEAPRLEDTDWPQILALYNLLTRISDNPMVTLNRAIAVAMVHGPAAGLELLATLDAGGQLAGHHRLDAVRAHFLEMAGNHQDAITHYRLAAGRTTSIPERNYLLTQAARLRESSGATTT